MPESEFDLEKLLRMLADDRNKYGLPLSVSARYTMKFILDRRDVSILDAIPSDVKAEILDMLRSYEAGEKLQMLSNRGLEDFTDEVRSFASLFRGTSAERSQASGKGRDT